jgi:hypothetical protein
MGWLSSGQRKKQCHSLAVRYDMRMIDETAWQTNKAVSLTRCWSWDEICQIERLPRKEMEQCHSLAVGHGMRHD